MYFPFYKSGISQVADRQDDGVPISANFPRSNEDTERGVESDETSLGESTKKRKLERDHFELVQPKFPHIIDNHHGNEMRKTPLPYIGMIAEAINSSIDKKMVLSEIYTYMEQHFFQYLSGKPRWRNTVRHNLSFHKCFVKCECSRRGNRSHFWSIHPDYIEQFKRGNFTKTLSPPREPISLTACVADQSFRRNPHEQFHRFFPNPSLYDNYIHYETIPPPNSNAYIQVIPPYTPTSNVLPPLPIPDPRSFPAASSSSRSITTRIPAHESSQRLLSTDSVLTPYQYPHLLPLPWQYQHIQMPRTTCPSQKVLPNHSIPTSQNSPSTKN